MPPSKNGWPPGSRSPGCAWPTSVPAPCCRRSFFPDGHFNRVPQGQVQQQLRRIFTAWGRPQRVRVDNGAPWGTTSDLPPDLALWLFGLDIDVHWNPPCCPQDNGVIERSQGLGTNWAEPERCASVPHMQRRLNEEDRVQREEYPSIAGQPRLTAFPQLRHNERCYSGAWEHQHWSWPRVCARLAGFVARRRVDSSGKLGVYGHKLYVGTRHKGLDVFVQFDPERLEWVVSDAGGRQLHRTQAWMVTAQRVQRLQVAVHATGPG